MGSLWKRSYVTVAILLVISFAISGSLWYQLEQVKSQLNTTKLLLDEVYGKLGYSQEDLVRFRELNII